MRGIRGDPTKRATHTDRSRLRTSYGPSFREQLGRLATETDEREVRKLVAELTRQAKKRQVPLYSTRTDPDTKRHGRGLRRGLTMSRRASPSERLGTRRLVNRQPARRARMALACGRCTQVHTLFVWARKSFGRPVSPRRWVATAARTSRRLHQRPAGSSSSGRRPRPSSLDFLRGLRLPAPILSPLRTYALR